MGVGTVVAESAFSVDELLADSVGGELVVVGCGHGHFGIVVGGGGSFVLLVDVPRVVGNLIGIGVHNR